MQERLNSLELVISTGEGLSCHLNDGYQIGDTVDTVIQQRDQVSHTLLSLSSELEEEQKKIKRQGEENLRRKHNYLPFITKLVEILAEKGHLTELIKQETTTALERKNNGKREREE